MNPPAIFACAFLAALMWISSPRAESVRAFNYPWCAHYMMQNGPKNCGFTTIAQCWASVSGNGGFCEANPAYVPAINTKRRRTG